MLAIPPRRVRGLRNRGEGRAEMGQAETRERESLHEQLVKYLTDAHSIEEQALQQMRAAPDIAGDDRLAEAFRQHLTETEEQERLVRERLEQLGGAPSKVKDVVMRAGGEGF